MLGSTNSFGCGDADLKVVSSIGFLRANRHMKPAEVIKRIVWRVVLELLPTQKAVGFKVENLGLHEIK